MSDTPLERILHAQGFGTRRDCRRLVRRGAVEVSGQRIKDPQAKFPAEGLELRVDDMPWTCRARVVLALHKGPDYECSRTPTHHRSVLELLPLPYRTRGVQPIGRLDQDTTGLLLLTDDGPFNHAISSPKRHVPKTYQVETEHPVDDALVEALLAGVLLKGEESPTRALAGRVTGDRSLELQIGEGRYHQVKRMMAAAGNRCAGLHRSAIGGLQLDTLSLDLNAWCVLSEAQIAAVREAAPQ